MKTKISFKFNKNLGMCYQKMLKKFEPRFVKKCHVIAQL